MKPSCRYGFLTTIVLFLNGACAHDPTPVPATVTAPDSNDGLPVHVVHHDVDLSLQVTPPTLSGRGELHLRGARPTRTLVLDAKDLRVSQVLRGATPLPFHQEGERLFVELPRTGSSRTSSHTNDSPDVPPAPTLATSGSTNASRPFSWPLARKSAGVAPRMTAGSPTRAARSSWTISQSV